MGEQKEYSMPSDWKNFAFKPVSYDLAEDFIFFSIAYAFLAIIMHWFMQGPGIYFIPLIVLAGICIATVARRRIHVMFLFFFFQAAVTAIPFFLPFTLGVRIILLISMFAVFVVSVSRYASDVRRAEQSRESGAEIGYKVYVDNVVLTFGTAILYLTYLYGLLFKVAFAAPLCAASYAVFFCAFEIYLHKSSTFAMLKSGKKADLKKMARLSAIIVGSMAVVVCLTAGITYSLYYASGLNRIDAAIVGVFEQKPQPTRFLSQTASAAPTQSHPQDEKPKLPDNQKAHTLNPVAAAVLKIIFYIILTIGILSGAMIVLIGVFHFMRIQRNTDEETQSVFSLNETAEKLRSRMRSTPFRALFTGNTNNDRVRKVYFRFIRRRQHAGLKLESADAPFDIQRKLKEGDGLTAVTTVYEKARYGSGECSDAELAEIRSRTRG